jgi:hypothetical protein
LLAQLLAFPGVQIRNRLMHPHFGQSKKDGSQPFRAEAKSNAIGGWLPSLTFFVL